MKKRLFLGIALDEQQTRQMRQLQHSFAKDELSDIRLVPVANLHMTLAFLGMVSPQERLALEKQISRMQRPRFGVTLDTLVHWKKPRALCIKGRANDEALRRLAHDCHGIAAKLNLNQSEHTFTPHITLARKVKHPPQQPFMPEALVLNPCEMHLFESRSVERGVEYHILQSWRLD